MSKDWIIRGYDGLEVIFVGRLPSNVSQAEVCNILRGLVCKHLSYDEILDSSRRRNDPKRKTHLDQIGKSSPLSYGENPYFVASLEN
jgi:hypothetical protein